MALAADHRQILKSQSANGRLALLLCIAGCLSPEEAPHPPRKIPQFAYAGDRDPTGNFAVESAKVWVDRYTRRWEVAVRNLASRPLTARFTLQFLDPQGRILNIHDKPLAILDLAPGESRTLSGDCRFSSCRWVAVEFPR